MLLTCPSCGCRASAEIWNNDQYVRKFMAVIIGLPEPVASRLFDYCGLFRAPGANRAMAWKKALRVAEEMTALVKTGHVQAKGKVSRPCPPYVWGAGMDRMIEMASTGQLSLPMKSHNYLVSIAWQEADKADASAESAYHVQEQTGHVRHQQPVVVDDDGPSKYELAYEQQYGQGALDQLASAATVGKVKESAVVGSVASAITEVLQNQKEKTRTKMTGYSSKEKNEFYISLEPQLQEAYIDAGRSEQHRIMTLPAEQRIAAVRSLL